MSLPDGVGSIDTIYDCEAGNGLLVRLTKEVDLGDLLVHLAIQYGEWEYGRGLDDPTILPGYPFRETGRQAQVGWFRKAPCNDGDHSWDMAFVSSDKPEGAQRYGAFLGVFLG